MSHIDKVRIREAMREQRRAYNRPAAERDSLAICDRVLRLLNGTTCVCTYLTGKDNEVDTWPLVNRLRSLGVATLAPRVVGPGTMEWAHVRYPEDAVIGTFGVPEPANGIEAVTPPTNAPVVTPGLAFSSDGHRVGYGGGYFDRFLAHHQGPAIGVAYDFQVLSHMPRDGYDMPMAYVVTPTRVYDCS